jgi:hypothetical protein
MKLKRNQKLHVVPDEKPSDMDLYNMVHRRPPLYPHKGGIQRYPGCRGLWGEWDARVQRWTAGKWYVYPFGGFRKTGPVSLERACFVREARLGKLGDYRNVIDDRTTKDENPT